MSEKYLRSAGAPRRRLAFTRGRWRISYLCADESGQENDVRYGLIVGPLVSDRAATLWIAVLPDGGGQRVMIRRDSIISVSLPVPGEGTAFRSNGHVAGRGR